MKSVGVKLKVFVKEEDGIWSGDDDVDGFVQLLRLTPGRGASTASWTQMTLRGLRPSHKTRSVDVLLFFFCHAFLLVLLVSLRHHAFIDLH